MDWVYLAQDRGQQLLLVKQGNETFEFLKMGEFVNGPMTVRFAWRVLPCGVNFSNG